MAHPRDARIAELKAQIESAKAEIKQLEADVQAEVAEDSQLDGNLMNRNTDAAIAAFEADRGLTGNRDKDGTLKPADDLAAWYNVMVKQAGADWMDNPVYKTSADWYKSQVQTINTDDLVDSDAVISGAGDVIGAIDEDVDPKDFMKKGKPPEETSEGEPPEETSEGEPRHMGVDPEEGRAYAKNVEPSKKTDGFENEGGFMSVNEKDDFWKTQEGHDKALEMYGRKPSWIKEPTMIWNPEEQKYEKIKDEDKEEFEDLSTPSMSADIKALFG